MQIRCSNPFDGSVSDWINVPDIWDSDNGGWNGVYTAPSGSYIVGAKVSQGIREDCALFCGDDPLGIASIEIFYCEFDCSGSLVVRDAVEIQDIELEIKPPDSADPTQSSTRAYH